VHGGQDIHVDLQGVLKLDDTLVELASRQVSLSGFRRAPFRDIRSLAA
jgi:hypothetical protein